MRKLILSGLTIAPLLIATPVLAQAQSAPEPATQGAAQRLSLAGAQPRSGARLAAASNASNGNWGWIIGAVGLIGGVAYALIEVEGDDDDLPASP